MGELPVIDSDGHVLEPMDALKEFLEPAYRRRSLFQADEWDRSLRGKWKNSLTTGVENHAKLMDDEKIGIMVLYPSEGLNIGTMHDVDYCSALSRAYNDWVREICKKESRLRAVALINPHDLTAAVEELKRSVARGAVGAFIPAELPNSPDWGNKRWDPLYAEAQRLDVPLCFHTLTNGHSMGAKRFQKYVTAHAIDHPVGMIMAMTATVMGGIYERFPKLRVGFMESGVGWVPYFMDRLDEEAYKRGAIEAPDLKKSPSEYIKGGQLFFGTECEEKTIPDAIRWGLGEAVLYSSDYPHWDMDDGSVAIIRDRKDLSDEDKRKFLSENAVRFYGQAVLERRGL